MDGVVEMTKEKMQKMIVKNHCFCRVDRKQKPPVVQYFTAKGEPFGYKILDGTDKWYLNKEFLDEKIDTTD